jgi:hypothetical protein
MFDQVCNESIRNQIEYQDLEIPKDSNKRMRLLSDAWKIRPMSYKQFSNLILKQNAIYEKLVKVNGTNDPLRKTLLIIDEAHKLYGGDDLSSIEKPDMNALQKAILHSYQYSGQDSVRLLLMTATPITKDPMELIKLINLCKPAEEQMPVDFSAFSSEYLDDTGDFTSNGRMKYLDDISGYVSYLNREKDARQFAQPQIEHIHTPIVKNIKDVEKFDKKIMREILEVNAEEFKQQIKDETKKLEGELGQIKKSKFAFLKNELCGDLSGKSKTQCTKVVNKNITELIKDIKEHVKEIKKKIKDVKMLIKERTKLKGAALKDIKSNIDKYAVEYEKYRETLLYELKNKCSKRLKNTNKLEEEIKEHPVIKQYNEEIALYNSQISNLDHNIKLLMENHKIRVKQLKDLLKTDLNDIERNVINMVIREESKNYGKMRKHTQKNNKQDMKSMKKKITEIEKMRKTRKREIIKKIKESIKDEKKQSKTIIKDVKKIRKSMSNTEDIKDEMLKEMVHKYRGKIEKDLVEVRAAEAEKIKQKEAEKEQKKLEKKQAKDAEREAKKQEKEKEKQKARETKKRIKEEKQAAQKLAKEKERATKKAARKTKKKLSP